jgi:hypothetical protein
VDGHSSAQTPHPVHMVRSMAIPSAEKVNAFSGQVSTHVRHPMQRESIQCTWGLREMLSGLWHHRHRRLQPLKNTVVRMPGPSSVDMRCISRTHAV